MRLFICLSLVLSISSVQARWPNFGSLTASEAEVCAGGEGVKSPNGFVCCPKSCGLCGGVDCHMRDGGDRSCCVLPVLASHKLCDDHAPPCILTDILRGDDGGSGGEEPTFAPTPSPALAGTFSPIGDFCGPKYTYIEGSGCVANKQICAEPNSDTVCGLFRACTGFNDTTGTAVCELQCDAGSVRLAPDTEPPRSRETCMVDKLICPNKERTCFDSNQGFYSECSADNVCVCAEGTLPSPADGHTNAAGDPYCVPETNKCEDGTVCASDTFGCVDNKCQCGTDSTLINGHCFPLRLVCEDSSLCDVSFDSCTDNVCKCGTGKAPFTAAVGALETCQLRSQLCFDSSGKATKSCADIAGAVCSSSSSEGECSCPSGQVLTSKTVYKGSATAATPEKQGCMLESQVCRTGEYKDVNRVCTDRSYLQSPYDPFPVSPSSSGYYEDWYGTDYSKRCSDGQCTCPEDQTMVHTYTDLVVDESCFETCGQRDGVDVVCSYGAVCGTVDGQDACICAYSSTTGEVQYCPVNDVFNYIGGFCGDKIKVCGEDIFGFKGL